MLRFNPLTSELDQIGLSQANADDLYVSKGELVLNVKDYGALGDGVTDDTAAIQDTVDAAINGGIVFIPAGAYIVDPDVSINLTSGITLMGASRKSVLKIKDNADVLDNLIKVENADRVVLKDFTVDGNRTNQDASDAVSVNYGVYVASSDDVRIQNVYVHDTTGVGIHVYNSVGTTVTDCESSGNRYHGFECEQDTNTLWQGNRGHHNSRHGIFISPGEVGGTGAIGNVIDGNSFDNNESYGVGFGIDAGGLSIGLTKDNAITNNAITDNAEYGISAYRVDDVLIAGNTIAFNGFFGIYLYRAERNQVLGNRLHNNSQTTNGAYDEILLEGANDGQASQHNIISDNFIYINGVNKANYGIREATSSDGPNVIKNNYIPSAGVSGRALIQHANTAYDLLSDTPASNTSSLRTFDDGVAIAPNATLPGGTMGLDAPFGTAALRFFNDNSGGNLQFVAPNGNSDWYSGGNNTFSVTSTQAIAQNKLVARAGSSSGYAQVGGTIFSYINNAGSTGTSETDLYSDSVASNVLSTDKDKLESRYAGEMVNSATATRQLKVYFGGTAIFDTGALSLSAASDWDLDVLIIRVSATVVRYSVKLNLTGASLSAYANVGELTGLTLSNANTLKITGQAAGVGAATNDIVAKLGSVEWKPAP